MATLMKSSLLVLTMAIGLLPCGANIIVVNQCPGAMEELLAHCSEYVKKSAPPAAPSAACCIVIKNMDVLCVCHNIPEEIMKFIDMQKLFYVTLFCGRPLPQGIRCGRTGGLSEP